LKTRATSALRGNAIERLIGLIRCHKMAKN
jgi:hypothetical protein